MDEMKVFVVLGDSTKGEGSYVVGVYASYEAALQFIVNTGYQYWLDNVEGTYVTTYVARTTTGC